MFHFAQFIILSVFLRALVVAETGVDCDANDEACLNTHDALSLLQRQAQMHSKSAIVGHDKAVQHASGSSDYTMTEGIIGCIFTAFTYAFFLGTPKLLTHEASRIAFGFWLGVGLLITTYVYLLIVGETLVVTVWSLLSGVILALTVRCTVLSIWTIGLTIFAQIQPPLGACIGFVWGHYVFKAGSRSMVIAFIGLAIVVIALIACGNLMYNRMKDDTKEKPQSPYFSLGIVLAVIAGFLGGSIFAPSHLVSSADQTVGFCLGLSIGYLAVSFIFYLGGILMDCCKLEVMDSEEKMTRQNFDLGKWRIEHKNKPGKETYFVDGRTLVFDKTVPVGLLAGLLMGLANLGTLYGCFSPVGVGITTAIRNAAGCASVLWGAFVFQEFGELDFAFKVKLLSVACLVIPGILLLLIGGVK